MVCLTPALLALRKTYPDTDLVILCENKTPCGLLSNWREARVLSMKEDRFKGISGKVRLLRTLRRFGFDLGVMNSVGPSLRSALILSLSGAKTRIGKSIGGRGFLNTIRFPEYRVHEIDANFEIFKKFGVERNDEKPFVAIPDSSVGFVKMWCLQRNIFTEPLVGLHPGAGDKKKRWDKYGELSRLIIEGGRKVIVFGSSKETDYIENVIPQDEDIFRFVGYPLTHVAAMISRCEVLIGNDSGLSHLSSALSVATVTIFGPSSWIRGKPYGERSVIIKSDLSCSPCSWLGVGIRCESVECLKRIKAQDVYRKAVELQRIANRK